MHDALNGILLLVTALIVISILSSMVSYRAGAPLLLVVLGVGLLAGQDGPGGIAFDDAGTAYAIGSVALALILFDSGFGTRAATFKLAAAPAFVLATIGVLLTTALVAWPAHAMFDFTWTEALLLGAIVSSTDAAAVFFLLRVGGITLRERTRSILEVESGSNDPMAIFLTMALVGLVAAQAGEAGPAAHGGSWAALALDFARQMGFGLALGVAGGYAITGLVNRLEIDGSLYPVLVAAAALSLFALTNLLGGSGYLAVYVAGIVAGNRRVRRRRELERFAEGLTWLAQIAMFVTFGLLATPSQFHQVAWPAIGLGFFLIFVARPLAAFAALAPFRLDLSETAFVGFIGLRGAVSILLAILPLLDGLPHARTIFNVTLIVVMMSLVIQGWGLKPLAQLLKLVVPQRLGPIDRIHLELPDEGAHELVAYRLQADSPLLTNRTLPRWVRPALIVREGRSIRHLRIGRLQAGDTIYVFVRPHRRPLLDRLVASPKTPDKTDREFFGDFTVAPDTPVVELGEFYGADLHHPVPGQTVREFLEREFGPPMAVGDRIGLGTIELVVRELDEQRRVTEVGLSLLAKKAR